MSRFLTHGQRVAPSGLSKLLYLHWPLIALITTVAAAGFLMLTSVAGGDIGRWAEPQMERFALGFVLMLIVALIPARIWCGLAPLAYLGALVLLISVEFVGITVNGARRWIDIGFMQLQPSEVMKVALVMLLAAYYNWLDPKRTSRPLWVLLPLMLIAVPMLLVAKQPDLGTALLLAAGGGVVMFLAGVSWWYFGTAIGLAVGAVFGVMQSRGKPWQVLEDYHYDRIATFLDPSRDPLGDGYNITQAKIAMGSGGLEGRGFMQGTQSRLNFLPEKHTDFIFNTLAEEFGLMGSSALLLLYGLIILFCLVSMMANRDRFGALLTGGIAATFFFYFAVNMAMVMGLAPVVGLPLPLVSYGGTAMLVLMGAFGLVQSAHVHRPRDIPRMLR